MAGVRPACGPGTPGQPRAEVVTACGSWPTGRLAFVPRTQRRRVRTVPTPGPSGLAGLRARLARRITGAASPPESRDQDQKRDHGEGADPDPPPALAEDDLALSRLGRGALDPLRPLALLGADRKSVVEGRSR